MYRTNMEHMDDTCYIGHSVNYTSGSTRNRPA